MKKLNTYYLVAAIAIVVLLKFWFGTLPNDRPLLMLTPLAHIVSVVTGVELTFMPTEGYYLADLHVVINRSCSGVNFWCISFFLLCMVAAVYPLRSKVVTVLMVPVLLVVSYVFTLFVNASRILLALYINKWMITAKIVPPGWLHTGLGIFIYLFFLIGMYMLAQYLFSKYARTHEKSA